MTSTPQLTTTTMHSSADKIPTSDPSFTGDAFTMQSGATLKGQTAHPTMAASDSPPAATPRSCPFLPHEAASLMEVANVHETLGTTEPLTYTADVQQFSETMGGITQPSATQNSQLDSTLLSKLPRELRDKIYRDAVVEDKDIPIRVTRYETKDGERRSRLEIEHPLMRVCKQTRQEVGDIYYLENTFRATDELFEKRAIRELSGLLTPWAERMTKLNVSHTIVRGMFESANINFSISAPQGRIVVEPEPSSAQYPTFTYDLAQATVRDRVTLISNKICFCKIFKLAFEQDGRTVLSWMQKYVDLVLHPESRAGYNHLLDLVPVHCWTCARRNVI